MPGGMSVGKLCSGDLGRQVAARSYWKKEKSCVILVPRLVVQEPTAYPSAGSMRAGPCWGSSLALERGVLEGRNVLCGTHSCRPGERRIDVGWIISFTSLSRVASFHSRKKIPTRLHCKAAARLSDVPEASPAAVERSLSDKFRELASDSKEKRFTDTTSTSISSPPWLSEGGVPVNLAAGAGITAAVFMMVFLGFVAKPRTNGGGSVSDLIKRGQLRSDRGADSANLTYDDPFNNPLVKMGNKNPVVRMCGKMFRLAPVTLTDEKVTKHQNRRIRAYKWKRPIIFLNEGDPVPNGVDPEEVRWIPANHPFATTSNFIDEELAQRNVYQTRGVPSRVRAEHEALRKKILETAQREPEFKLPSMEDSGAQAWTMLDETQEGSDRFPADEDKASDSVVGFGKQVNGNGGSDSPPEQGGGHGGTRNGVSESRYRTIDFSGEEQGSSRN